MKLPHLLRGSTGSAATVGSRGRDSQALKDAQALRARRSAQSVASSSQGSPLSSRNSAVPGQASTAESRGVESPRIPSPTWSNYSGRSDAEGGDTTVVAQTNYSSPRPAALGRMTLLYARTHLQNLPRSQVRQFCHVARAVLHAVHQTDLIHSVVKGFWTAMCESRLRETVCLMVQKLQISKDQSRAVLQYVQQIVWEMEALQHQYADRADLCVMKARVAKLVKLTKLHVKAQNYASRLVQDLWKVIRHLPNSTDVHTTVAVAWELVGKGYTMAGKGRVLKSHMEALLRQLCKGSTLDSASIVYGKELLKTAPIHAVAPLKEVLATGGKFMIGWGMIELETFGYPESDAKDICTALLQEVKDIAMSEMIAIISEKITVHLNFVECMAGRFEDALAKKGHVPPASVKGLRQREGQSLDSGSFFAPDIRPRNARRGVPGFSSFGQSSTPQDGHVAETWRSMRRSSTLSGLEDNSSEVNDVESSTKKDDKAEALWESLMGLGPRRLSRRRSSTMSALEQRLGEIGKGEQGAKYEDETAIPSTLSGATSGCHARPSSASSSRSGFQDDVETPDTRVTEAWTCHAETIQRPRRPSRRDSDTPASEEMSSGDGPVECARTLGDTPLLGQNLASFSKYSGDEDSSLPGAFSQLKPTPQKLRLSTESAWSEDTFHECDLDEFIRTFRNNPSFLQKVYLETNVPMEDHQSRSDEELTALFGILDTDFSGTLSLNELEEGLSEIRQFCMPKDWQSSSVTVEEAPMKESLLSLGEAGRVEIPMPMVHSHGIACSTLVSDLPSPAVNVADIRSKSDSLCTQRRLFSNRTTAWRICAQRLTGSTAALRRRPCVASAAPVVLIASPAVLTAGARDAVERRSSAPTILQLPVLLSRTGV